ncbi:MAG: hypothetical protein IBX68_03565 [Dehalococcoidia bacterium]|nr:hypothetical protein [Dehalococcoidia bacterium]
MDSRFVIFRRTWFQILISGLAIFAIIFAAYTVTENIILLPAAVLVGSFLVPAVFVVYLFERLHARELALFTLALTFFWGGAFGIAIAGLLQPTCPRLDGRRV